jgi:hypothetical protein
MVSQNKKMRHTVPWLRHYATRTSRRVRLTVSLSSACQFSTKCGSLGVSQPQIATSCCRDKFTVKVKVRHCVVVSRRLLTSCLLQNKESAKGASYRHYSTWACIWRPRGCLDCELTGNRLSNFNFNSVEFPFSSHWASQVSCSSQ